MEHKNYLLYYDPAGGEPAEQQLRNLFGSDNVYKMNSSDNLVIKIPADESITTVMDKAGFSSGGKARGIIVEFVPGCYNGWYSPSLWDFIRRPVKSEKTSGEQGQEKAQ